MRTRTVTVREGELLGPVDWTYDFAAHDWNHGGPVNPAYVRDCARRLRDVAEGLERGEEWEATTDGGWPRVGWGEVLAVGMYDGWPYWKPHPSILIRSPLGAGWKSVFLLSDARRIDRG